MGLCGMMWLLVGCGNVVALKRSSTQQHSIHFLGTLMSQRHTHTHTHCR